LPSFQLVDYFIALCLSPMSGNERETHLKIANLSAEAQII
jgi:hypothetical protein